MVNVLLILARLLLAAVFIVAGLAKLADRAGSQQALRDFGVPSQFVNSFGVLLPLAELVVAVALIFTVSAWWGAIGALVLVLLFIAGISYNLARGRTPDCHCFGQIHSAPIGWPTLIRNLLLAAIAAFVVGVGRTYSGPDPVGWLGMLAPAQRLELLIGVILVALLAFESWMLLQVLRQQGRLLLRIEALEAWVGMPAAAARAGFEEAETGLPVGTPAPAFALSSLSGETITLSALLASGKAITLLFSDPGCGPCMALLPEAGRWQRDYADKLTLAFISRDTPEVNRAKIAGQEIAYVLLQRDREVAEAYKVVGTPSAVLIRSDGTIGSPPAGGADAIRGLVAGAIGLPVLKSLPMVTTAIGNGHAPMPGQRPGPKAGDPAPALNLPDLSGKPRRLTDFRGNETLVLFWDPNCSFCQQMLKDLKAWEARRPREAPKLLVVSTGTIEANQAMGLRSPVLLDQDFTIGSMFGIEGTPIAVLVDAEGKIASEPAEGASAIFALAGSSRKPG